MNLEYLANLERIGKIKKEEFARDSIIKKYGIAFLRIKTAEKLLKNNFNDESVYISAYSELYNSFRMLCEVMLAHSGYRVGSGLGHHETAISTLELTLEDAEVQPSYLRLQKIGKKRDGMEYGGNFNISAIEMKTMLEDVKIISERVEEEIDLGRVK